MRAVERGPSRLLRVPRGRSRRLPDTYCAYRGLSSTEVENRRESCGFSSLEQDVIVTRRDRVCSVVTRTWPCRAVPTRCLFVSARDAIDVAHAPGTRPTRCRKKFQKVLAEQTSLCVGWRPCIVAVQGR